jgi:protein ImuA
MAKPALAQETFFALRHAIARIEGRLPERLETPQTGDLRLRLPVSPTGVERFDAALGGGLPQAGLVELHGQAVRDGGAVSGFALALARLTAMRQKQRAPLLWIATTEMISETGRPYAPGLAGRFGLSPQDLIFAEAAKLTDVLWLAEEAANAGVFSSILVELRGSPAALDLTATRRLHRRTLIAGHPLFLLRQSGTAQPTAAPLRLLVRAGPATRRRTIAGPLTGSIGPPAFHVSIDKSRAALAATSLMLEWTHDAFCEQAAPAYPRALVPAPAGGARLAPALRPVVAFPYARDAAAIAVQQPREQHAARRSA